MKNPILILILLIVLQFSFRVSEKWIDFESSEYGFKIKFPQKPTLATKMIETEIGPMTMNTFYYEPTNEEDDPNLLYAINVSKYQKGFLILDNEYQMKEFFKKSIQGYVNNLNGTLVQEEIIDFHGFPGCNFKLHFNNDTVIARVKIIVTKDSEYMLSIFTLKENESNKSIDRFLDSVELEKN
jgi:hypothetical protein